MTTPASWRQQIMDVLSWYGGQVRAVATEVVHPISRTVQGLVDDSAPTMVELVATQEQLLLGVPLEETADRRGHDAMSTA